MFAVSATVVLQIALAKRVLTGIICLVVIVSVALFRLDVSPAQLLLTASYALMATT